MFSDKQRPYVWKNCTKFVLVIFYLQLINSGHAFKRSAKFVLFIFCLQLINSGHTDSSMADKKSAVTLPFEDKHLSYTY